MSLLFFFFFQAEDGIRDWSVTGVQTCALPISSGSPSTVPPPLVGRTSPSSMAMVVVLPAPFGPMKPATTPRSEERRVGKECRSRWSADHSKKKGSREDEGREDCGVLVLQTRTR